MKEGKMPFEVTKEMVIKAIEETKKRWLPVSKARSRKQVHEAIDNTGCGFCGLSDLINEKVNYNMCDAETCPLIEESTSYCCEAWRAYTHGDLLRVIKREAVLLVEKVDSFDPVAIAKKLNMLIEVAS